ncbi:MAG: pyridoxamine 5'-phosphate oxidase family protein [Actinomycetota bacterium]|nr:pyridoxamine 5'-phosphate oxidase family protein [Actinomycetota bacterium]
MSPNEYWFPSLLREMSRTECLELLASHRVGRVAYCDDLGPVVLPVNYVMDKESVLIQVSPHSTLARNLRSGRASFEVDDFVVYNQSGWSVLVRGDAAHVESADLPDADSRPVAWPRVNAPSTSGSPHTTSPAAGCCPPERKGALMTTYSPAGVPMRDLVALATRAPSVHNTQPWHWCIAGERLTLFADSSRQLQYADPDGRDLVISCGAALQHLQVAAAAAGWKAHVRRMPNPDNDAQLANVSFRPEEPTPGAIAALDALINRRTDRRRPTSWPVPRERLDGLLALAPAAGVTAFGVVSHTRRAELLQLLAEAEKTQRQNRRYVDEILR